MSVFHIYCILLTYSVCLRLRQLGADLASAFQVDGGMNSGHVPSGRPRSNRLPALPELLVSFLFLFSFFFFHMTTVGCKNLSHARQNALGNRCHPLRTTQFATHRGARSPAYRTAPRDCARNKGDGVMKSSHCSSRVAALEDTSLLMSRAGRRKMEKKGPECVEKCHGTNRINVIVKRCLENVSAIREKYLQMVADAPVGSRWRTNALTDLCKLEFRVVHSYRTLCACLTLDICKDKHIV